METRSLRQTRGQNNIWHPGRRPGIVQLRELLGTRLEHKTESQMPPLGQQRKRSVKRADKLRLTPKVTRMHHWLCVYLFFGSLTDFSTVQTTFSSVAKAARLGRQTVRYILQKFIRDGYKMVDHYRDRPTHGRGKITAEVAAYLTSKDTLQAWAGYPLKWRLGQLKLHKGVDLSYPALLQFYKKHGITYRATGYMKYSGFKVTDQERWQYARMLKNVIDGDKALIYVDESSFNTWRRINKTWAPKYNVINLPQQDSRGHGLTVYGAIGTCLKKAVFTLGESTNPEGYCAFLREVRRQFIGRADEEIYVVADGHKAHSGRVGSAFMIENNFIYL